MDCGPFGSLIFKFLRHLHAFIMAVPISSPTSCAENSLFFAVSPAPVTSRPVGDSHSDRLEVILAVGLICILLIIDDIGHLSCTC